MLHQEAHGLEDMAAAKTLRVPKVLGFHEPETVKHGQEEWAFHPPQYLILEFVRQTPVADERAFSESFGRNLAALHRTTFLSGEFGLYEDNFIGRMPQDNRWMKTWVDFYRERRILPQMEIARDLSLLPLEREKRVMALCERLPELLDGLDSAPSLLHGDLWSGNYLSAGSEPVVFDPAVYYGEREMEIAFMQLFGGFPARLFDAYNEVFSLQEGYEFRRPLHQLYPLLVHLNHFGESYGPDVDAICRGYLN